MIRQIFKIIWAQRRINAWIFCELLVVLAVLWLTLDIIYSEIYVYNQPLGYDITNTYRLKLANLDSKAANYLPDEERTTEEFDDLLKLMEQIRRHPEVEAVCATYYSAPYSNGDSWAAITPIDGDTTEVSKRSYQLRRVTLDYFDVFRVNDKNGQPVAPQLDPGNRNIVISADMEKLIYHNQEGKGRRIKWNEEIEYPIAAVSQPIRVNDFRTVQPCFYDVMGPSGFRELASYFGPTSIELGVRMKQDKTTDQFNEFLLNMGDQLVVNNIFVFGYETFASQREMKIANDINQVKIKASLLVFMLINVFFGIIGTFWLRTQKRKNEIGLRLALGSNKKGLYTFMYQEGICLVILTIPFLILFMLNVFYFDLDLFITRRFPLNTFNSVLMFGSAYLLVVGMVCLGIYLPARKATAIPPAEALHYE